MKHINLFLLVSLVISLMLLGSFIATDYEDLHHELGLQIFFGKERLRAVMNQLYVAQNAIDNLEMAFFQLSMFHESLGEYYQQAVIANYGWQSAYDELIKINEDNRLAFIRVEGNYNIVRREIISCMPQFKKMDMFELYEALPLFLKYLSEIFQLTDEEKEIWNLN